VVKQGKISEQHFVHFTWFKIVSKLQIKQPIYFMLNIFLLLSNHIVFLPLLFPISDIAGIQKIINFGTPNKKGIINRKIK